MIETDTDRLAARLSEMPIATPEFLVTPSAPAAPAPVFLNAARRRRTLRARVVVALALLVIGVAATYPSIGQVGLRWVGLLPEQVQPLTGTVHYGEGTLTVAGGYADEINTVLFIGFDNIDCTPFLTDQFGSRYDVEGGVGIGVGAFPAIFDPLRGQASTNGARITLHCPVGTHDVAIRLSGTLMPHSAHQLEVPAKLVVDGTTYEIVGLRWSGTYLEVHTKIYGKLIDQLTGEADALKPHPGQPLPSPTVAGVTFPGVFLIPEHGSADIPVASMNTRDVQGELEAKHVLDEVRVFRADHAGKYRIVVSRGEPNGTPTASWSVTVS